MAFGLAVYASPRSLPPPTQDSLPAAGQALPGGLSTRRVPLKGFRAASYISSSFPKLSWRNCSWLQLELYSATRQASRAGTESRLQQERTPRSPPGPQATR